jgi:hypothetical protein
MGKTEAEGASPRGRKLNNLKENKRPSAVNKFSVTEPNKTKFNK